MMKSFRVAAVAVVALGAASTAQAANVTISLGQTAEDFILYGQGANGSGDGTYTIQQGSESYNSVTNTTTDSMTGSITGSSKPGLASGSYDFVTTYLGTPIGSGGTQIQGESNGVGSDEFFYTLLDSSVDMTLFLTGTPTGNYTIPLVTNGAFDGPGFGFGYVSSSCSGLTALPCSQYNVGITPGASISGPVDIGITVASSVVPEPSTWAMMLAGLAFLGYAGHRTRRSAAAAAL
jgi:hypothetical protein